VPSDRGDTRAMKVVAPVCGVVRRRRLTALRCGAWIDIQEADGRATDLHSLVVTAPACPPPYAPDRGSHADAEQPASRRYLESTFVVVSARRDGDPADARGLVRLRPLRHLSSD